jgi:spermidine synthase
MSGRAQTGGHQVDRGTGAISGCLCRVDRDLVELCQRSDGALAFEKGLLELLQVRVGFDAAFLLRHGGDLPTRAGMCGPWSAERGATYAEELMPVKRAALEARGVAVDTHVLGERAVRATSYHREVAARVGGRHTLMAYVPFQGQIAAAVMLGRTGRTFGRRDIVTVEDLLPAIGVARAAFGLAYRPPPLPRPRGLLRRLARRRSIAKVRSNATEVTVRDRRGFREMVAREGGRAMVWSRASLDDPSVSGWPYVDLFHLAASLAAHRGRALFLGCGGGVAMHQFARLYPRIAIDVVESDDQVLDLARGFFQLDAIPGLTTHTGDGAAFVAAAPPSIWDVVVIDAYDAADLAAPLGAPSFLESLRRAMRPGGAAAFNVVSTLDGAGDLPRIVTAARSTFDDVRIVPVVEPNGIVDPAAWRNVVITVRARERS